LPKSKTAAFLEQAEEATRTAVNEVVEAIIQEDHSSLRKLTGVRASEIYVEKRQVMTKALAKQKLDARRLEMPKLIPPYAVGRIGKLVAKKAEVSQIVGPEEMLVDVTTKAVEIVPRQTGSQDASSQSTREVEHRETVLIRGMKTALLSKGKQVLLPGPLEVVGSQRYEPTTGNSKTIMALTPFQVPDEVKDRFAGAAGIP
jgi:hypothetical protein